MENLNSPTVNISEEEKRLPVYKLSTDDRELSSHNEECNACNENYNDESQSIAEYSMESMEDSKIIRDLFRIQEELKAIRTLLAECIGYDDEENFEIYEIPDIRKLLQDRDTSMEKEIKSSSDDTPQSKEKKKNTANPAGIVQSFVGNFMLETQLTLKQISRPKVREHVRQLDALFGTKISTNCNRSEMLITRLKNKVKNRNDMNDTNRIIIITNDPTNTTNNVNNNNDDLNKSRNNNNTNNACKNTVEKNIEVTDVSDKGVGSETNVDLPKSKTASGRTGRSKNKSVKIGENGKGAITEAPSCPSTKTCHSDVCVPQNSSINCETCQQLEEQIKTCDEHKNDITNNEILTRSCVVSKDDCSQSSRQRTAKMIDNEIETSYMNSDKSVPGEEHINEDILVNTNATDIETSKWSIVKNNDFDIELKEAGAFEVDLLTEKKSVDENSSAVAKEDNESNASLSEGKLDQMDLPAGVTMEEKTFLCKPCNAKFTEYKRIVDHSRDTSHEKHVEIFSKGIVRTEKSLYLCTLCSCNFKNLTDAEAHLETCQHQKNGKPTAENMNLNESSINQVADKSIEEIKLPDGFKKKGKIISCQVCNVSVGASQNIIQHSNTRQHRIYRDALQHGIIRLTKSTSRCKLCDCTIRKLSGVEEHLNSDQHKKNSKVTEEDENSSTSFMNEDISNSRDCLDLPDGIIKIENDFLCEPCDVQFLVHSAAVTHSKSKNHQKQLNLRHKSIIGVEKILHKSIPDDCPLLDSAEAKQQSGSNEQERNSRVTSGDTDSELTSIDKIDDEPHHISADIIQKEEGLFDSVCRIEDGERLDTMEHSNSKQHQIYESTSKSDIIRVTVGETTCEFCNCTLNGLDELEKHMMSVEHRRNVKSDGECEKSSSEVNIIEQAENTVVESEEKFVDKTDVTVRADNEIKSEIKSIDTTDSIEQAVEQCTTDLLIEEPEDHTEHSNIEQREINDNPSQDIIVQDSETPNKCRLCDCFMIGVHGVQEHLKSIQHIQMLELVADADNFMPIPQNPSEEKPLQRKCRLQEMKEVEKKKGSSIFELQIDNSEPTSHEKQLDIPSENLEERLMISECSGNLEPPAETEIPKLETNEKIDQESIEELTLPTGFVKKRGTLFCTFCQVGVGAYHNLVEHSQTRKHKIHYEASTKGLVQIYKKESYCQHCNCNVVGTDGIEKHLESSEHMRNSGLATLPIDSNKSITNENGEKLENDAINLFDESPKETRDSCNNRSSNFPTESTEEPLQVVEDKGNSTLCHESRSSSSTSINQIDDLISFELTPLHEITKEETESSGPINHTEVDKYSNVVEHTSSTMQLKIDDDTLNGEDIIQVAEEKDKGQFYHCTAVAECPNKTPSPTLASFLYCQPENMKNIWSFDLGIKSDLDNKRYPELSNVTSSSSLSFGITQHDNKSNPSDLDDKLTFIEDDTKRVETNIHISTIFPSPESERGLYESFPDRNGEKPPLTDHSESAGSLLSATTSSSVPSFSINDMLEKSTPCLSNNQYVILPVKEHANAPKMMFHRIENQEFLGERPPLNTDNIKKEEIKFSRCSICNWVVLDTYANIQRHLTSEKHQLNQQSMITPTVVKFYDMASSRFFKIESHIDWNTHLIKVLEVPRDQFNMMEKCFNWCDFCETRFDDEPSAHLRSQFHQELLHGIKPSGKPLNSTCSICTDIIFFPIISTINHINEPSHQKNLLGRTTNIRKSSIKLYFSKSLFLNGIETIVEDFLFICIICNCRIISTMDAEKHLNDPSHKARGKAFILKIRKNVYSCLVCYRLFFNLVAVEEHLNDKHHQVLRRRMSNVDPVNIVKELLKPVKLYQLNEYTCSICNSRIEGDLMFVLEHTLHQRHQTLLTGANFSKVKQITLSEVITEALDVSPLTETISIENAVTLKPIDQYEIADENPAIPDTVNIQGNETEQRIMPWENENRACNICNIIIPGGEWNLIAHRRTKQHLDNEEKLNAILNIPICQLAPIETKKSQLERRILQDDIINIPDNNNNPVSESDVMSVQQTSAEPVETNGYTIKGAACTTNKKPTACSTVNSTPCRTINTTKILNKKTFCCNFCNEETTNEYKLHSHITRHLLPRFLVDIDENSEQPKNTDNDDKDSKISMKFLEAQSAKTEVLGDAESTEKVIESPKKLQSSKWRKRSLDISLEDDINIYEVNEQKKKIIQTGVVLIVALGEERVYCLVCQRTVNNTPQIIYDHVSSISHLTFLQQIIEDHWQFKNYPNELSDLDLAYQYMEEIDDLSVQCHVCQKQLKNDTTVLNDHIENGRHKKAWATLAANAKTLFSALSPRMSGDFYTVNYYWCVPCELKFSMEIDFRKHLRTKKHLIEVDKFSTIGEPLIFDYCAICSTLWCGFFKTFGYHSMCAMHKNYISRSSPLITELPPSAERLLHSPNTNIDILMERVNNLLPENIQKETLVIQDLEKICNEKYPFVVAHPFGSRVTRFGDSRSDFDIFLDCSTKENGTYDGSDSSIAKVQERLLVIKSCLKTNPHIWRINWVILNARTPIIKAQHLPTLINCDLSFTNGVTVESTKLVKNYCEKLPICRKMIIFIKNWMSHCGLIGSAGIHSCAVSWMVIFFLQVKGLLPTVHDLILMENQSRLIGGWQTGVSDDFDIIRTIDDIVELLENFFTFYATYDYRNNIICPLLGKNIEKTVFQNIKNLPSEMETYVHHLERDNITYVNTFRIESILCIQDPFDLSHNITKAVKKYVVYKLKSFCSLSAQILEKSY